MIDVILLLKSMTILINTPLEKYNSNKYLLVLYSKEKDFIAKIT